MRDNHKSNGARKLYTEAPLQFLLSPNRSKTLLCSSILFINGIITIVNIYMQFVLNALLIKSLNQLFDLLFYIILYKYYDE